MIGVVVLAYLALAMTLVDAFRRPDNAWAEADRQKGFWVAILGMSVFFIPMALVLIPAYLLGVLPRMSSNSEIPDPYRK